MSSTSNIGTSILGPFNIIADTRRDFALRSKLLARAGRLAGRINIDTDTSFDVDGRGSETHLFPWRKSTIDDGAVTLGKWSHVRPVFPAISGFGVPSNVTVSTDIRNNVPPAAVGEAFYALEDSGITAPMEARTDIRSADGRFIPAGWPCLIVKGVHDHEERLLAFAAGGPMVAQHRGSNLHTFSSRVHDMANVGLGRFARLHSAFRVDPNTSNRNALAWNLTPSVGDGTGEGFVAGVGDLGPRESAAPGGRLTLAMGAWQRGGPFHVGAINDKHRISVNSDGVPINPLHFDIDSLFYDDAEKDGSLDYERDPWRAGRDFPFIAKVHFRWNPLRDKFGWFSSSLFSPATTPPPPPPTTPPPPPTTPPSDPPPTTPPFTPGDPPPTDSPEEEPTFGIVGQPDDFDEPQTGEGAFGFVPGKRKKPRGGRGNGKGEGGGDGSGGIGDNEFEDALDDLDAKDRTERDRKRKQDKARREKRDRNKKPPLRKEDELSEDEQRELERIDALIDGLRQQYQQGRLTLEQYLGLFQSYKRERDDLLRGIPKSKQQEYQVELDALTQLFRDRKISAQEYADRVRDLKARYGIGGTARKLGAADIDRRGRKPSNQWGPATAGSSIVVPELFMSSLDSNAAIETGGRYGQDYPVRQEQPLGGHLQNAANSIGGQWSYITGPGQILRQPTADSITWVLPPERSVEESEQDPVGTAGGSSCVGLGVHGGKGQIGLGVPSRGQAAASIWNGCSFALSGPSGSRALNINPINATGGANPSANVNVNGFLSTSAGMGFGPVEALVPILPGGVVPYSGNVVHRIIGSGVINEITNLPTNAGTLFVIMPSPGQNVTIADNAIPAFGGRNIRTRSGASVVLANTWEPFGAYDCPVTGSLAQLLCC